LRLHCGGGGRKTLVTSEGKDPSNERNKGLVLLLKARIGMKKMVFSIFTEYHRRSERF